ncbi:MAG: TonB-dependent receptor [Candidatus Marinimicrobia bacterium]|nr:TonB-dependent receptor [Candidatus Neomarinimicrobiota bacterium]
MIMILNNHIRKMMISSCLFMLVAGTLYAGTTGKISGRITDAETGEGLPGVNVMLQDTYLGASTDANGVYFIINIPSGSYTLRAQMIGYSIVNVTDVKVRTDLTTEVNVKMAVQVHESEEEVVVVAERPLVQKDLTSGRSIVSADDIKEMPVESVGAVIATKAGIVSGSDGSIHIRGGRSSEVTYMIDGVPVTNPAFGGLGVNVENSSVQELQILSGTFNAEYGQAMSGIINIITKEGGDKFEGSLSGYAGDYKSTNTDIFEYADQFDAMNIKNMDWSLSGPVPIPGLRKKFSFFASGRFYENNGLYRGIDEHNPWDANYLTAAAVENLQESPWGRAGLLVFAEPFTDMDGDGALAAGSESYFDLDGDGSFTPGEPFADKDGDGQYTHNLDMNGDGVTDAQEREFIDLNGDGVLNGDPFVDTNFNGVLDGEPYLDFNRNGMWDSGSSGSGDVVRLSTYSRNNIQAKLTWKIAPTMKLNFNVLNNSSKSQGYSRLYKYNPDGRPSSESRSTSLILDFTHSLGSALFYNIKGSFYESYSKSYYRDVQPDELVETERISYNSVADLYLALQDWEYDSGTFYDGADSSLLVLQTTVNIYDNSGAIVYSRDYSNPSENFAASRLYNSMQRDSTLADGVAEVVLTMSNMEEADFLPTALSELPNNEYYGGGHSHSWSERRNRTYLLSSSLTWQMNNTHQVKAGGGVKQHIMDYRSFYVFVNENENWVPTAKTPETSFSNNSYDNWLTEAAGSLGMSDRRPLEAYFFIQDKIELTDMIVNIGLRYDYFNANYFKPSDYADPDNPKYLQYTVYNSETGYYDTLSGGISEVIEFDEILDTLNATGDQWKDYADFYVPVPAVHQFSPRIGVAYPITDKGIIHFSYGHFFQVPTYAYLYSNPDIEIGSGSFSAALGNPGLKPQKTVTYELGLQQELTADLGVELIAFYKGFSGLLSSEKIDKYNTDSYVLYSNRDYGNTRGITLSVNKRRTGLVSASADYTYQVAQGNASNPLALFYANQSDPPQEVPKQVIPLDWDQSHTVNVNVSLSRPRNWAVTLLMKYGSGLPYSPSLQGTRLDEPNSDRKPDSYNVDLNARKEFEIMGQRISFFAKVYNVFDTLNERYVYDDTGRATYSLLPTYTPDEGHLTGRHSLADFLNRPSYFSSPRQFRVGFSMNF